MECLILLYIDCKQTKREGKGEGKFGESPGQEESDHVSVTLEYPCSRVEPRDINVNTG